MSLIYDYEKEIVFSPNIQTTAIENVTLPLKI